MFLNSLCLFWQIDIKGSKDKKKKKKKSSSEVKKDDESVTVTSQRIEGLKILSHVDEYERDSSDEEVNASKLLLIWFDKVWDHIEHFVTSVNMN